jgi:hypothetical protein
MSTGRAAAQIVPRGNPAMLLKKEHGGFLRDSGRLSEG